MNLAKISDQNLISSTEALVREEQALLTKVLHHLREIDRRKLFSSMGYTSIYDFAVKQLRFSEDQAYRRIAAMRMLRDIPELEEKINAGEISLSHIGLAHSLFRQERKFHQKEMTTNQKLDVLNAFARKPIREAEKLALAMSSQPQNLKPDRVSAIRETHLEIKFCAPRELLTKIETLKGLLAHSDPEISMAELMNKLCEIALEKLDPARKTATSRKLRVNSKAQIRRDAFAASGNRCTKCGSTHALQIDHIYPKAWGGQDTAKNLRVLCRNCNQRAAIQAFGRDKMLAHQKSSNGDAANSSTQRRFIPL